MLEVTNMEHRNDELDVCVVSNTIHGILSAGFAECALVGCPLHKDQPSKQSRKKGKDAPDAYPELRSSPVAGL